MAWCSALAIPGESGRCTCGLSGCSDWPGGGGRRPSPWGGGEIAERGSGRRRAPASRRRCGRSSRGWNDPPAGVEGREIGVFGLGWAISRSGLVVL